MKWTASAILLRTSNKCDKCIKPCKQLSFIPGAATINLSTHDNGETVWSRGAGKWFCRGFVEEEAIK
jgi:hypothetical protein